MAQRAERPGLRPEYGPAHGRNTGPPTAGIQARPWPEYWPAHGRNTGPPSSARQKMSMQCIGVFFLCQNTIITQPTHQLPFQCQRRLGAVVAGRVSGSKI